MNHFLLVFLSFFFCLIYQHCCEESHSECRCGLVQRRSRIIGGATTEVNEYPWMVSLLLRGTHGCGGTLISNRWILSAAHCFIGYYRRNYKNWKASLGEHDRRTDSEADHINVDISKIINHPDYLETRHGLYFDFSLVKMTEEVDFSLHPHIRPVCLPANVDNSFEGVTATATGWGVTDYEIKLLASVLQEVDVTVLSNQECTENYGYYSNQITDQMLCANVKGGGKDACKMDSGGPLIARCSQGKNFELIGVISWGEKCGLANYPGVYARVTQQLSWISEITSGVHGTCPR